MSTDSSNSRENKYTGLPDASQGDFKHDFSMGFLPGINVGDKITIINAGIPYAKTGIILNEIDCLRGQIKSLTNHESNTESLLKSHIYKFHPSKFPEPEDAANESHNKFDLHITKQTLGKPPITFTSFRDKKFKMGRKWIDKTITEGTNLGDQTAQVVELLNNLGIKHNSAMLTDAVALGFWPLLKDGNEIYFDAENNQATLDITDKRFIIYVIDCVEMRNDPATGKGNFKKELAQYAGGVLLKFIKPRDPQNTTYKWTPSDTQDIIKNDNYEVEPENSWFSNYEFKLLTDTYGEGCTLIIRHSDTDQVIINDPKHENTITTIKNFLEDLFKKKDATINFGNMFNYKIQQKRSGDWLQVLVCLNVKNMEWVILNDNGNRTETVVTEISEVYFLTHDQIALAFAINVGVSSIFTHGTTHTITSFKKDSPDDERNGLIMKAEIVKDKLRNQITLQQTNESGIILPEIPVNSKQKLAILTVQLLNPFEDVDQNTELENLTIYLTTFNEDINWILNRLYKISKCTELRDRENSRIKALEKIQGDINRYIRKVNEAKSVQPGETYAEIAEENKKLSKAIYNVDKYIDLIEDDTTTEDKISDPLLSQEQVINVNINTDIDKYFNKLGSRGTIDNTCGAFDVIHSIDNIYMITPEECAIYKNYFNNVAMKVMELFSVRFAEIKKRAIVISAYCREFQTHLKVICPDDVIVSIDSKKNILNVVSEINSITSTDGSQNGGMFFKLPPPPPPPTPETIYNILLGDIKRDKNIRKKYILDDKLRGTIKSDLIMVELLERIREEMGNEPYPSENPSFGYRELVYNGLLSHFLYNEKTITTLMSKPEIAINIKEYLYNQKWETNDILLYLISRQNLMEAETTCYLFTTLLNVNKRISYVINETGYDVICLLEGEHTDKDQPQIPIFKSNRTDPLTPRKKTGLKRTPSTETNEEDTAKNYSANDYFEINYFDYDNTMSDIFDDDKTKNPGQTRPFSTIIGDVDPQTSNNDQEVNTKRVAVAMSPTGPSNWLAGYGGAPQHQEQLEQPEEIEDKIHLYRHNRGCRIKPSNSPTESFETIVKMSSPTFENEQRILNKLADTPFSSVLFPIIIKQEGVTLGTIENDEISRCMEEPDGQYTMITCRNKGIPIAEYFEELKKEENPELTFVQLLESFVQGLKMVSILEQHTIVHMDINENTITYDKINGTLAISDFSMSFDKEDHNNTKDEEIFVEYDGEMYWTLEVYLLSIITELEPEARQQVPTKEEVDSLCMKYAEESSLRRVVDEATMTQYMEMMKSYVEDTMSGQTWDQMNATLKETAYTWDVFSLIVLFLRIIENLSIKESELVQEVRQQLCDYIITRPNMMRSSKEIEEEIRQRFGSVERERVRQMDQYRDPMQDPTQDPPTQDPMQDPMQDPTQDPTQDPMQDPTQDPIENFDEDPPIEDPTQDTPTQDPTQDLTQDFTQDPTQDPIENFDEDLMQQQMQDPTQDPMQDLTQDPVQQK